MAAAVETMYYVSNEANGRFVPWHKLGVAVEEAPSSSEAIKLAGLDWTVKQEKIKTDSGIIVPGYMANMRSTDNKVLGVVTEKYKIVQNADAFAFTDSLIESQARYETAGSLFGGRRVWMLMQLPKTKILDDETAQFVCFTNTHDGSGAIRVCLTPVRVVCNNTLNFALNTAKRSWSTKHMGNMESKLEEARNTLGLAEKYMQKLGEFADKMANEKVDEDFKQNIINTMFYIDPTATKRQVANVEESKAKFIQCMLAPDLVKYANTKWQLLQAATDYADHADPARMTANYKENNWGKIIDGHPFVDKITELVVAA